MDRVKVDTRLVNRLVFGLVIMAGFALLYFFAPDKSGFYPRCLLHSLTGLHCPFCGGLRATHQLLHGNFRTAFALNPLFILSIPTLFVFASIRVMGGKLPTFISTRLSIFSCVIVLFIFAVLRNTSAFSRMAP